MTRLEEKYGKRGFKVVAVNGWDESKSVVAKFVDKEKLKHTILLEGSTVADDVYGVDGYPSSYWIDHEGKVLFREEGFTPFHVRAMEQQIERLLARRNRK